MLSLPRSFSCVLSSNIKEKLLPDSRGTTVTTGSPSPISLPRKGPTQTASDWTRDFQMEQHVATVSWKVHISPLTRILHISIRFDKVLTVPTLFSFGCEN